VLIKRLFEIREDEKSRPGSETNLVSDSDSGTVPDLGPSLGSV
jgi:hypothetical protein